MGVWTIISMCTGLNDNLTAPPRRDKSEPGKGRNDVDNSCTCHCCRIGMRMGFAMRQQSIAAVYAKALRLNSSSIADVSPGKVSALSCSLNFLHPCKLLQDIACEVSRTRLLAYCMICMVPTTSQPSGKSAVVHALCCMDSPLHCQA